MSKTSQQPPLLLLCQHPVLKFTKKTPNPCDPGRDSGDPPSAPAAGLLACACPQKAAGSEARAEGTAGTVQLSLVPLRGACRAACSLPDPNSTQQSYNSEFPLFYEPVAFKSCLISI